MLKLTIGDINSMEFANALQKISTCSQLAGGVKTKYNLGRLIKEVQREAKTAGEQYIEMAKPFCILDEKGDIVRPEKMEAGVPFTFKEPEGEDEKAKLMEDWKAANDDFMAVSVAFEKVRPMTLDELEGADLTAGEIGALDPIITELSLA